MRKNTFLAFAALLAASTVYGGDECLITNADLTLRTAPPSGLFYQTGESVGTVSRGDVLAVRERKNVKGLFGEYKWVEADVLDAKTQERKAQGWVYTGKAGGDSYTKQSVCGGEKK